MAPKSSIFSVLFIFMSTEMLKASASISIIKGS
jgi:hypothetical protein